MEPQTGGGEEDDCVDSGAETGGSDYSHMSSTSSELSLEEAQDPFLVSIHIIADPGESQALQEAVDRVLAWVHPDLQLFRVSERRASRRRRRACKGARPALAVVLFLQEEFGDEQILHLHRTLQRPPWRHHHTERVAGRLQPYLPCSQDFFSLGPGTPLWAVRPVHYGREIVRFTVYCRHHSYADSLRLYGLILRRSPSQRKADFCVFPIFSNLDVDIQFSLKRLPCDQTPAPADSAVLEFRVRDIGELVPLLPNPCSPISEGRWQTEDLDGNKILLQAQKALKTPRPARSPHLSEQEPPPLPSPSGSVSGRHQQPPRRRPPAHTRPHGPAPRAPAGVGGSRRQRHQPPLVVPEKQVPVLSAHGGLTAGLLRAAPVVFQQRCHWAQGIGARARPAGLRGRPGGGPGDGRGHGPPAVLLRPVGGLGLLGAQQLRPHPSRPGPRGGAQPWAAAQGGPRGAAAHRGRGGNLGPPPSRVTRAPPGAPSPCTPGSCGPRRRGVLHLTALAWLRARALVL
ncbi:protein FAM124A isoform X1 [Canis lupus dingo]|uniref:protein FAM124A isoform X1 n=1 Tax=Canis lupus dingo TaxID=286419 RepID=UPI0020C2CC32|nr:protein FAM124A isoform X1 [Canis lupus dingo]